MQHFGLPHAHNGESDNDESDNSESDTGAHACEGGLSPGDAEAAVQLAAPAVHGGLRNVHVGRVEHYL